MEFDLENPFPSSEDNTLNSLFLTESSHIPPPINFNLSIRNETVSSIINLSRTFDPFLSYLSINYLDRFLPTQSIPEGKPWFSRLVAVSCVSLAIKMRKAEDSISITDLQQESGFIFDSQTVERMELLILGALKWRMRSITPFSFMGFFISLFKFQDPPLKQALKDRATEIVFKAQNEIKLVGFEPSIVAASALLWACHELFPLQFQCFRKAILNCSCVNKDNFSTCYSLMQEIAMDGYESVLDSVSSSNSPVNVLDGQWSTSNSDSETTNPPQTQAIETFRVDKSGKRRKITGFRGVTNFQLSQPHQHYNYNS